jgi:TonB-dependent starch-binding outer membrane protein SusC
MKKISLVLMMVLFGISFALAQRTITGLVTDKKGEALIGASVLVKSTSLGMVTDVDGRYNIAVPAGATTLIFTFVGYETLEVKIGSSNTIDVQLDEDSKVLAGVVIVETGTGVATDKRKVATDVQTIGARALPPTPTASIDQALVGKIAGAQISSVNGTPGAKTSILLRGINTLNRGTNPMIMMDGVELGATDLNAIGLASIDRVEVVQGAASASIYGAQGANGVIQLFSKRGKKDELNIEFSSSYVNSSYLNVGGLKKADLHGFNTDAANNVIGGTGAPLKWDPALGTYSENLIWNSTSSTLKIDKPYDKNLKYVDHFAMFLQDAPTTNNNLSISGGKGPVDFAIGLGQNTQESNFIGNGNFKRTNLNANIGIEIAKGLTLRSTTQLIHTNSTINDGGKNSTIYALFNTRPFIDYSSKMADGNYAAFFGNAQGVNGTNPFYINQYSKSLEKTNDVIQGLNLNYSPFKVLELSAKYGLNYQNRDFQYTFANQNGNLNQLETGYFWSYYGDGGGEIRNETKAITFQNLLTSATLKLDAKKDLGINLPITSSTQVAYDYRNKQYRYSDISGVGLPSYLPATIKQAASQQVKDAYSEPFITFGYLVNQHFDFGEVAGVSAGFRSDYSSAFGGGSTPFTFPHASGYFRPSSMAFWQKGALGKIMPEVKLRAAYGQAGIQPKPFDRYITLGTKTVGSTNALYLPQAQSNPDLGVEVSTETEVGADITLAGSKGDWFSSIVFAPTYWSRTTDNAIYDVAAAPSTGVFTKKDNAFALASNGFQFSLATKVLSNKDFEWNFIANYTQQSSTITKVQGQEVVVTSAVGSTGYVLKAGEKVGQIFGFLGLHSLTEQRDGKFLLPQDQVAQYEVASNGWVVNKATKAPYFTPDQYSFGDPNPLFNMAFINSITYKKFLTLNFQFDWIQGSHIYNQTKEWMYRDGIHSDYQQPITINGETGAWSAFYRGVYAERSRNGTKSYFYEDASFVRLRNLELVIDLAKMVTVPYCKSLQMTIGGRNLMTWTKYTGLDPEVNSGNAYKEGEASAWDRGTDHNTMPNLRSYQLGFRVGF